MAVATFDTLKFANTLKAAGVPDKQAEAQAVAFAEVIQLNFKELVTKDDLARGLDDLRKDVRHELKDLEQRLANRIDLVAAKSDTTAVELRGAVNLLRWMVGVNATVVIMTLGLAVRFFIIRGFP